MLVAELGCHFLDRAFLFNLICTCLLAKEEVVFDSTGGMSSVISKLRELECQASTVPWKAQGNEVPKAKSAADASLIAFSRNELSRVLDFLEGAMEVAERANVLLVNAYSLPADELGVRLNSEDAVKLQWALRNVGVGNDSGESPFTV